MIPPPNGLGEFVDKLVIPTIKASHKLVAEVLGHRVDGIRNAVVDTAFKVIGPEATEALKTSHRALAEQQRGVSGETGRMMSESAVWLADPELRDGLEVPEREILIMLQYAHPEHGYSVAELAKELDREEGEIHNLVQSLLQKGFFSRVNIEPEKEPHLFYIGRIYRRNGRGEEGLALLPNPNFINPSPAS